MNCGSHPKKACSVGILGITGRYYKITRDLEKSYLTRKKVLDKKFGKQEKEKKTERFLCSPYSQGCVPRPSVYL